MKKGKKGKSKKGKKKQVVESESEYETVSESENDVSDVDEEDDDYFPENEDEVLDNDELDMLKDGNMKFNIIFTTGPSSQITTGPSGRACGMNFLQDEFLDDEFDLDYEGMFEEYDDAEEHHGVVSDEPR